MFSLSGIGNITVACSALSSVHRESIFCSDLMWSQTKPPIDPASISPLVSHSTHPSSKFGFSAPPNGVVLETLDQLRAHLPEVQKQVSLRTMPLGNLTGMTDDERTRVLMWIGHGAAGRVP